MKKQVDKKHYNFLNYVDKPRWNSYYKQIEEVLKEENENVLIIGAGDKIVPNILKTKMDEVKIFDIAEDLNPDYIGDILKVDNILEKNFDCVLCCQVLEHLPFDKFEKCIEKLEKITEKKCIISLPQQYIRLGFLLKYLKYRY